MALASANPERDSADDLLTTDEVAALLRVTPAGVDRWIAAGLLPVAAPAAGGRPFRLRRADLDLLFRPEVLDRMADEDVPIPPPRPWVHDPSTVDHGRVAEREASRKQLTDTERQEALAALEAARQLRERIRAGNGGKPLPSSWPLIRQAREER